MKTIDIKEKLEQIDVTVEAINLGDFDFIGELCAKRQRPKNNSDYAKCGAFYRANYERGILLYYLIRQFKLTNVLEIGTGRAYSTMCAARAFHEMGTPGLITTIDPALEPEYVEMLSKTFPRPWFNYIKFIKSTSEVAVADASNAGKFDLVIIDGDKTYDGILADWYRIKDRWCKFVIIDIPEDNNNETNRAIQKICDEVTEMYENHDVEVVIMDRQLYPDDRPPVSIDMSKRSYGQMLITMSGVYDELEW